jgi:hypothetical protein
MESLREAMNAQIGNAREALARGLIDKAQFRRVSQEAAREFNAGILTEENTPGDE